MDEKQHGRAIRLTAHVVTLTRMSDKRGTPLDQFAKLQRVEGDRGAGVVLWRAAVATQLARVLAARDDYLEAQGTANFTAWVEPSQRLDFDVHFLLVAIAHVHRYAERVNRLTGDERTRAALDAFAAAVPGVVALRDYVTHLDDYLLGDGRFQEAVGPEPSLVHAIMQPTGRVHVYFGPVTVDLEDAAAASGDLAVVAREVASDRITRLAREGALDRPETEPI